MTTQLTYVILFVANMDESVRFYRDTVGLVLKYQSPYWSEFVTGETTLALHPASDNNPSGKVQIGLGVAEIQGFYDELRARGVTFTQTPTLEAGAKLARFLSPDGTEISVSGA